MYLCENAEHITLLDCADINLPRNGEVSGFSVVTRTYHESKTETVYQY